MVQAILALLPAALFGLYAYQPAFAFLPYLAPVPWLLLYTDPRRRPVSLGWYFLGVWVAWMAMYRAFWSYGWYAPPMMALFFVLPWTIWAPILRAIHARTSWPRSLTVPIVTVAVEWLRVRFATAHFDVFLLGYSQARFPLLTQIADLAGVFGVSFLVASVGGLVADAWFAVRDGEGPFLRKVTRRQVAIPAALVAGLFVLSAGYGAVRLSTSRSEPGPRLAIVQPNVRHTIRNLVGVHLAQMLLVERLVTPGAAELIVLPENAIFADVKREAVFREDLAWLAERKRAPILLGAQQYSEERPGRSNNAAVMIDGSGTIVGEYAKRILYPWSEYVPLDDLLGRFAPSIQRLHRSVARMAWGYLAIGVPGTRASLMQLPWNGTTIPFAAMICVENTYPPIPSDAARSGARFFVNITSEGEVAGPIQEQLLRVCMLRAVENRLAYVRCGNTGISAFIDPAGRMQKVLRGERGVTIQDAGVLIDRIPISKAGPTLYARSRDGFAWTCLIATFAMLVGAYAMNRRRPVALAAGLLCLTFPTGCGNALRPGDDPTAAGASLAEGKELLASGRPKAALAPLAAACGDEAVCKDAVPLLTRAFAGARADEAGAEFFEALAGRWPALAAEADLQRGHFLEASGDLEGALASYDASLRSNRSAGGLVKRGKLLLRLGQADRAIEALREAAGLSPDDPRIAYPLAQALAAEGRHEEARRLLEASLAAHPTHAQSWALLGRVRASLGDREGALEALRRALRTEPNQIGSRYELARLAMREGRFDETERLRGEIAAIEATLGKGPTAD